MGTPASVMKLNIAWPETGAQKSIDIDDDKKLLPFFDKRVSQEVSLDSLGDEFKGYRAKISGGNDKQGFPMLQGILTPERVRLLLRKGSKCYRQRRTGEMKRKSVRGCIVSWAEACHQDSQALQPRRHRGCAQVCRASPDHHQGWQGVQQGTKDSASHDPSPAAAQACPCRSEAWTCREEQEGAGCLPGSGRSASQGGQGASPRAAHEAPQQPRFFPQCQVSLHSPLSKQ